MGSQCEDGRIGVMRVHRDLGSAALGLLEFLDGLLETQMKVRSVVRTEVRVEAICFLLAVFSLTHRTPADVRKQHRSACHHITLFTADAYTLKIMLQLLPLTFPLADGCWGLSCFPVEARPPFSLELQRRAEEHTLICLSKG